MFATVAIIAALWHLYEADTGFTVRHDAVDRTPVSVFVPSMQSRGPAVVIAHGFAGSQQLMQGFAVTLARNGYTVVTFDFAGHGRNPVPLSGDITREDGATRTLMAETARIVDYAKGLGDGRVALLGHSMATDIIVRVAQQDPAISATIAVSMLARTMKADSPKNLLVIVGGWEDFLKREALRAVELVSKPKAARAGVTYGSFETGSARRAAFSPGTEHVSVLYSQVSMRETVEWVDSVFGIERSGPPYVDRRGPWIMALIAGVVLLAWPLSSLLPVVARPRTGAGLGWRRIWIPLLVPPIVTPLLLRIVPTHFLPVLVADYLAAHFATYGLLTAACLLATRHKTPARLPRNVPVLRLLTGAALLTLFSIIAIVWPVETYVTSFTPGPERTTLILALLAGTLLYFTADEWLTRGDGAAKGAYWVSKVLFLASLMLAIALDFERLFFLVIILPVIVLFFAVYGLFSTWAYRRTGHPWAAALANAVVFALAIGVTFPLLAG